MVDQVSLNDFCVGYEYHVVWLLCERGRSPEELRPLVLGGNRDVVDPLRSMPEEVFDFVLSLTLMVIPGRAGVMLSSGACFSLKLDGFTYERLHYCGLTCCDVLGRRSDEVERTILEQRCEARSVHLRPADLGPIHSTSLIRFPWPARNPLLSHEREPVCVIEDCLFSSPAFCLMVHFYHLLSTLQEAGSEKPVL